MTNKPLDGNEFLRSLHHIKIVPNTKEELALSRSHVLGRYYSVTIGQYLTKDQTRDILNMLGLEKKSEHKPGKKRPARI